MESSSEGESSNSSGGESSNSSGGESTSEEYDTEESSSSSDSGSEEESDDDLEPEPEPAATNPGRGRGRGRGRGNCRVRGGIKRGVTGKVKATKPKKPNPWKKWNEAPFTPQSPTFNEIPGPKIDELPNDVRGFVKLFITEELIEHITDQTNLYAWQYTLDRPASSRESEWRPVTMKEMEEFIAITILIGIHGLPGLQDYWSTDGLFHNPIFHAAMGRNRYQLIMKYLHFNDNTGYDPKDPNRDRLYKIRPLLEFLVTKFQELYYPTQEISIDEQLLKFKGRLHFKQYIPNKRSRFGIKLFTLCDKNGYVYNTTVYTGKSSITDEHKLGKSGAIVLELLIPLLNKGHKLFIDNWYTSLKLLQHLVTKNTGACGTIRRDRGQFPAATFTKVKLANRGDTIHLACDKILALRFKDRKDVFFLSTLHRPKLSATQKVNKDGNPVMKEQLVIDYNHNMGFVDKNDQIVNQHTMVRKSHKWTTKVAFHLLEEAIFNAHVIYQSSHLKKLTFLEFKMEFVRQILQEIPAVHNLMQRNVNTLDQHFPEKVPVTNPNYTSPVKRCYVCHRQGIRATSRYQCDTCIGNPGFCIDPCFKLHHKTVEKTS